MAKGLARVVGVSGPSTSKWSGTNLPGVQNDATSMSEFFARRGFDVKTMLNTEATRGAVLAGIDADAGSVRSDGDMYVFYFAGHGLERPGGGDEKFDQMLMTSDEGILDDELGTRWPKFEAGVRIVVITDSCHAGSAVRTVTMAGGVERDLIVGIDTGRPSRTMSIGLAPDSGDTPRTRDGSIAGLRASLLHIAACLDPQESLDLGRHGFFTDSFLQVWLAGNPVSYDEMFNKIRGIMSSRPQQTPLMSAYGNYRSTIRGQRPFDLNVEWPPKVGSIF
jgi:Caspase domain.